jgi:hypothetical protein
MRGEEGDDEGVAEGGEGAATSKKKHEERIGDRAHH